MCVEDAIYSYTASSFPHVLILILPVIPERPQDWNIDLIDNLIQILSIESETFDFKRDFDEKHDRLYKGICAMANTSGGHIVLGIGEEKTSDGRTKKFTKEGFAEGEQDKVNQRIASNVYMIEPTPVIDVQPIYERDGILPTYFKDKNCVINDEYC
jgi:hypothetical protein